jgi:hypothetical protein
MTMKGVWRQCALLFVVLAMLGCSKDEDPKPVAITAADFEGEWSITTYKLAGTDETAAFSEFTFEIFSNGDFLVNKNGQNDSYGSYEVDEATKVLTVDLTNPKEPSKVIDGTWQVYEKTDESMTLKSFEQGEKKDFVLTKI